MGERWIVLMHLLVILGILLMKSDECQAEDDQNVCNTEECKKAADSIKEAMDSGKDPCNGSFYEFACGKWIEKNPIPAEYSSYDQFTVLSIDVMNKLKELLEGDKAHRSKSINGAKTLYKTCKATETIEQAKSRPLLDELKKLGGGFPLLDGKYDEKADFTELIAKIRLYGVFQFFTLSSIEDQKDPTKYILDIDQKGLPMAVEYFLNQTGHKTKIDALKAYFKGLLELLSNDIEPKIEPPADFDKQIEELLAFYTEIAKIVSPPTNRVDPVRMYNIRNLTGLQELNSYIKWDAYFKIVLPSEVYKVLSEKNFRCTVSEIDYLKKLQTLLEKTNKRTIMNYIMVNFVMALSGYLDSRFEDNAQNFNKAVYGNEQKLDRWKKCYRLVEIYYAMPVGAMFVQEHFKEEDKQNVLKMTEYLEQAFVDMLNNSTWMEKNDVEKAKQKLNATLLQIGYPDEVMDDNKLDEKFKDLDIQETDSYFAMRRKLAKFYVHKNLKKLLEPVDRNEFYYSPASINAYYDNTKVKIVFLAAILQPPFYYPGALNYVNYGVLGSIIGHEIVHAFDDSGRKYDVDGSLNMWWDDKTTKGFEERANCFRNQYFGYTDKQTNLKLNGNLTLSQNIAESEGLRAGYRAYQLYLNDNKAESQKESQKLPGLEDYSNDKIFFISFARAMCQNIKNGTLQHLILTDSRSPNMFRIDGPLSNFVEFKKAFNCPEGSNMNPKGEKCTIW